MKLLHSVGVALLSFSTAISAASSWSFEDGTVTIQGKGSGVGGGVKEKYVQDMVDISIGKH